MGYVRIPMTALSVTSLTTAQLTNTGGSVRKVSIPTINTTLDSTYDIVLANKATAISITLPEAATNIGRMYTIKNIGAGACTVLRAGTDTIDGATSKVLNFQYETITLVASSAGWSIIGKYAP